MKHYIYILSNPATDEIFYVGCTQDIKARFIQHKYSVTRRTFQYQKATEKDVYILAMQTDPVLHVIEEVVGFKEVALIRESFWITFLLQNGFPLVNKKGKTLEVVLKSELYGLPKQFTPIKIEAFNAVCSEASELEKTQAA